jgi:tripartite-type tricarboxylate transporter receptor subunit TctC
MFATRFMRFTVILFAVAWPFMAGAQDYPSRTITIVVPFAAGGGTDALGRLVAQKLALRLGKSVVVENRPGAGSMLGAGAVAKADPAGYTLLAITDSAVAVTPVLYKAPTFNPMTDFVPLSMVSQDPFFLAMNPNLPIASVAAVGQGEAEKPLVRQRRPPVRPRTSSWSSS